jgi:hypothetical protein
MMTLAKRLYVLALLALNISQAWQFRVLSTDFKIAAGSQIVVDGKPVGTAPCQITLKTNIRHKLKVENEGGNDRTFCVTWKEVKKSAVVNNIPSWFLNPALLQSDFRDYEALTPGTASSTNLAESIRKAELDVEAKLAGGGVDRYFTIRQSDSKGRLDSGSSSYYPKLTRGQMDSIANVNGGKIVARSLSETNKPDFLELEIQKTGSEYRVYVLAGKRKT